MKTLTLGLAALALVATTVTADVNLKACAGCHGGDWSKSALGKSKVVSEMSQEDIVTTLKGYKDGTYNSAGMAGLMKGQVSKYSDEELTAAAATIKGK